MKRNYRQFTSLLLLVVLVAWGPKGHQAVALIAEKHLNTGMKAVVESYLDGASMEDVSTWADEHHTELTAPWHFINLPQGLNYAAFDKAVREQKNTVYTALLQARADIQKPGTSKAKRAEALRYLIHLVADAHQPMHVSRKGDRGGNDIKLQFEGHETNMHSLWDGKLIERDGLTPEEMAAAYDNVTQLQVKQWQQDSLMQWLWESYQLSGELYRETKPGQNINDAAYRKYIAIIRKRILQAGIRLAGELNTVLKGQPVVPATSKPALPVQAIDNVEKVSLNAISGATGKTVTVSGKVYGTKDIGRMLLIDLGAAHPNQLLTVAAQGKAKAGIASELEGKTITVTGKVILFKGKPEIIVEDSALLQVHQ